MTTSGPTTVSLAGSTGSIGTQTLEVIAAEPDRYRVVALGAGGGNVELLVAQAPGHRRRHRGRGRRGQGPRGRGRPARRARCGPAPRAWPAWAPRPTSASTASSASPGCEVTLATLEAGRRLALANKESLIAGAPVVQPARRTPGAELVPVDSEHCAIHMCLRSGEAGPGAPDRVARVVLTASGGPFRGRTRAELAAVTVEEALAHPTWSMGPKITVDSSTLMNKGLEVIEAHELFGTSYDAIEVVVHPQSIIHSMVEFTDGATVAQLSLPDMRLPDRLRPGLPGSPGGPVRPDRLGPPRSSRLRAARPGGLPLPAPGLRGRTGRRRHPGAAQRGQRGRGRGLPGGWPPLVGHP